MTRCWFFWHNWTGWTDYDHSRQRRHCTTCGQVQLRDNPPDF